MNRILYSGLFYLALPVLFLRLLWLSSRMPEQRQRWRERLALYPAGFMFSRAPRCVLIHAVSVGEVHAAKPLIEKILDAQQGCSVVVTTSTPTGSARVRSLFADRVFHLYLPYDLPGAIRRFLDRVNPDVLVIMETELWPNLIHYCARRQVRILLANARLSDKSFRGYARIRSLTRTILGQTDMVCAQAQTDGVRLINLGLDPQRLIVTGSIKFDQSVDQDQVDQGRRLRQQLAARRPVLISASTRDGEERKC
ncbi:MAG: glycosyltransferase N-terminal domain-containing protein [Pseudohongiellaceae bacterium]